MTQEIQAIRLDVQDIGKHVKASKKRFSWTFGLNGRQHTIILDFSFISGKVKLIVDRKTMLQSQLPTGASFQHPFTLDGYALNILQQGETFQLRINNKVFSHLYNQAKTNTEFKNYEDEIKDIKVNQSKFQNSSKTVKLNIGALDGAKKKNKQTAQSQNWGNFGGNQLGIPSFFGETQSKVQQKKQLKKASLLDQQDSQASTQIPQKKTESTIKAKSSQQVDFFADNEQKPLTSPSQQHLLNIMNEKKQKQQFNTMQQLFSTMNISNQAPQNKQASNLDLIINTPGTTQAQTNSLDFNTMQNFFATQNQTGNPSLNFNNPNTSINPNSNISPATDFNTMQQMFATIAQNNNAQNIVPPSNYQAGDASNFYSMYNLFATSNNQGVTLSTPQQAPSLVNNTAPQTSANNFPTIHNLFATSSHMPTSQMGSTNLGNINNQDFSTMQNLFKTSGTGVAFPPPSVSVVQNKNSPVDPFNALDINPVAQNKTSPISSTNFNTYSGFSNATSAPNASSFGTIQQNQNLGGSGSIDLFSLASSQKAAEVPNFSKKKQAANMDLI